MGRFFKENLIIMEYLKTLDPNGICIFIDGYISIALENEEQILKRI